MAGVRNPPWLVERLSPYRESVEFIDTVLTFYEKKGVITQKQFDAVVRFLFQDGLAVQAIEQALPYRSEVPIVNSIICQYEERGSISGRQIEVLRNVVDARLGSFPS